MPRRIGKDSLTTKSSLRTGERVAQLVEEAIATAEPKLKKAIKQADEELEKSSKEVLPRFLKRKEVTDSAESVRKAWKQLEQKIGDLTTHVNRSSIDPIHKSDEQNRRRIWNAVEKFLDSESSCRVKDKAFKSLKDDTGVQELLESLDRCLNKDTRIKEEIGLVEFTVAWNNRYAVAQAYAQLLKIAGRDKEARSVTDDKWTKQSQFEPLRNVRTVPWYSLKDLRSIW